MISGDCAAIANGGRELVSALCALTRQVVAIAAPIVEGIIREPCRDVRHIERALRPGRPRIDVRFGPVRPPPIREPDVETEPTAAPGEVRDAFATLRNRTS